jgi:hypothetical protein
VSSPALSGLYSYETLSEDSDDLYSAEDRGLKEALRRARSDVETMMEDFEIGKVCETMMEILAKASCYSHLWAFFLADISSQGESACISHTMVES